MKKAVMSIMMFLAANICFAGNLGGGYMGAKWGMSPDEVKNTVINSGNYPYSVFDQFEPQYGYRLIFYEEKPGDRQEKINFYFDNDKLYGVKYMPYGSTGRDEKIILKEMKKKYGNPNKTYNGRDGFGFLVKVYEWNDGTTKISLQAKITSAFSTQVDAYYFSIRLKKLFDANK